MRLQYRLDRTPDCVLGATLEWADYLDELKKAVRGRGMGDAQIYGWRNKNLYSRRKLTSPSPIQAGQPKNKIPCASTATTAWIYWGMARLSSILLTLNNAQTPQGWIIASGIPRFFFPLPHESLKIPSPYKVSFQVWTIVNQFLFLWGGKGEY